MSKPDSVSGTNLDSQQNASPVVAPAAGKGLLDRSKTRSQPAPTGPHDTAKDKSLQADLQTPNERDQITSMTGLGNATEDNADPMIAQAAVDAQTNLKDTSKAMETDRAYAKLRDKA